MRFNLVPVVALTCLTGGLTWLMKHDSTPSRAPLSQGKPLPPLPKREDLAGMSDADLEETLYGWLLHRIEAEDSLFDSDREILVRLPAGYIDLYATRSIEELLEEGGFAQLMGSVDSRFLPDAIQAYRRIGAVEHASILVRAQEAMRQRHRVVSWENGQNLSNADEDPISRDLDARLGSVREDARSMRSRWIRSHLQRFLQH